MRYISLMKLDLCTSFLLFLCWKLFWKMLRKLQLLLWKIPIMLVELRYDFNHCTLLVLLDPACCDFQSWICFWKWCLVLSLQHFKFQLCVCGWGREGVESPSHLLIPTNPCFFSLLKWLGGERWRERGKKRECERNFSLVCVLRKVERGIPPPPQKALSYNGEDGSHLQKIHNINILPYINYYIWVKSQCLNFHSPF